jgi:hypothetical protein
MTLILPALLCSTFAAGAGAQHAEGLPSQTNTGDSLADDPSVLFTEDGAWCWFQDPE